MKKKTYKEIIEIVKNYETKIQNIKNITNENYETIEIEKIENAKDFFFLVSIFPPQSKSFYHQSFIERKLNWKKVSPKENRGDSVDLEGKYYEIKCSTPSMEKEHNLNLVQIRPFHNLDYYLCVFIDDVNFEENYVFLLTKEEMAKELEMIGTNAHGTQEENTKNKNIEYRFTVKLGKKEDFVTKRWLEKYRNINLEQKIFN